MIIRMDKFGTHITDETTKQTISNPDRPLTWNIDYDKGVVYFNAPVSITLEEFSRTPPDEFVLTFTVPDKT